MALLAFGIGTNVAVFAVLHALLIQPLPYKDPHQLVRIWESNPALGVYRSPVSRGNFADWRERSSSFQAIEAFAPPRDRIIQFGGDPPEILRQASGTAGFMRMMGVDPIIAAERGDGLLLGHAFWQRRFGGDPAVTGRTHVVEGFAAFSSTVAGVMPRGFDFPIGADAWGVLSFGRARHARNVNAIGRLAPGVTLQQARLEMNLLAEALAAEYPAENAGWVVELAPLQDEVAGGAGPTLWLLYGAVSIALIITVINVNGLALASAMVRRHETAVRLALGATPSRILRQQFIEFSILVLAAAGLGLGLTLVLLRAFVSSAPATLPRLHEIGIGGPAAGLTAIVAGTVLVLLWTLVLAANRRGASDLALKSRSIAPGHVRARSTLLFVQLVFCVTLLVSAGIVVTRFVRLQAADPGYRADGVLTAMVRQPIMKTGEVVKHYPTRRFTQVAERMVASAKALPGVQSAAVAYYVPGSTAGSPTAYKLLPGPVVGPLRDAPPVAGPDARPAAINIVGPKYFETLRIPIIAGRAFVPQDRLSEAQVDDHDADRGAGVAIVNDAFVRRNWPDGEAIGRYLAVRSASYRSVRVVGVASDVTRVTGASVEPTIYLPYAQAPMASFRLLIHAKSNPSVLAAPLRHHFKAFGSDVAAYDVLLMEEIQSRALAKPRFSGAIMSMLGSGAILLTGAGLFTLLTFVAAARRRELAIRAAVGASTGQIMRLILHEGVRISAAGVLCGIAAALVAGRALAWLLPELGAPHPAIVCGMAVFAFAVSLVASYVPARRAARVDPAAALRAE